MRKLYTAIMLLFSVSMFATEYYLQGGCVPSGWSTNLDDLKKCQLVETSEGSGVYQWTGVITSKDNFKITTGAGWGNLHPSEGGVVTLDQVEQSVIREGGNDDKWVVSVSGEYKVTLTESGDTRILTCERVFTDIANADDLIAFAERINNGDCDALLAARLTADIDMAGKEYTPMGINDTKGKRFAGLIDGQEHKISNLRVTSNDCGLVQIATGGAVIKNLILDSSCEFNAGGRVAAFVSCCNYKDYGNGITIENCGNEANVSGTGANCAAFLGCDYGGLDINIVNCYNTGKIQGSRESAVISGWLGNGSNKVEGFWNIGEVEGQDGGNNLYRAGASTANVFSKNGGQGTEFSTEDIASGKLCYLLNGNQSTIGWFQNLSGAVDKNPVPFKTHAQVYANGQLKCDGTSAGGELTYSNSNESVIPPHTNVNGWCTVCGTFHKEYITPEEGFFPLASANDVKWFAAYVDQVNQQANAKLTADIDYTAEKQGFIGKSQGKAFKGTFDGQEHTMTIAIVNDGSVDRAGLFAYIKAATIKNLIVEGTATSADRNCVGGLGGRSDDDGTLIDRVIVKTDVSYTGSNGDATCGGFFANMEAKVKIQNSAFLGSIDCGSKDGCGGLVGWAGGGQNNEYINCLVAPTSYTKNGNSAEFARNNPKTENCHYVSANDARLASGELCDLLGDAFRQTLGEDQAPTISSKSEKVFSAGELGYTTLFDETKNSMVNHGAKAYIVVVSEGKAVLKEVSDIPKGTAVVVKGDYFNNVAQEDAISNVEENQLIGTAKDLKADEMAGLYPHCTFYTIAGSQSDETIGFHWANETGAAFDIKAGKAYLALSAEGDGAKDALLFTVGDHTTGVETVKKATTNDVIYNLQGQRVNANAKGIIIVNGKKVMNK